jgi:phosphatidylglycerol---prolipoprotein diacylglyceryl transferase
MGMISYIIWNGSPEIFETKAFALRWYGLLFILGFLISQQILYYIHQKENKPEKDVDTLTIYMIVATIIGARLGHVLFYSPEIIWENPLGIFLPFEFNPFRFTGLRGLASHGGAAGILFALWLYARKNRPGQSYLQVVDRIVILVALTGALIRIGNYFNSEIIGTPTAKPWGVVFVNNFSERLDRLDREGSIESIEFRANDSIPVTKEGGVPMNVYVLFRPNTTREYADQMLDEGINIMSYNESEHFDTQSQQPTAVVSMSNNIYAGRISTIGIARHPAQLYESISCILLFVVLFMIWSRYKNELPPGRLLGIFLIWCFGLRFLFEFLKEVQVPFENELLASAGLNMGQILSIPLILAGIVILVLSYRKKA